MKYIAIALIFTVTVVTRNGDHDTQYWLWRGVVAAWAVLLTQRMLNQQNWRK